MGPTSCQAAPPRARRNEDYSWPRKTVSTICDEMECRMIEFGAAVKPEFLLESGVAFLNHGSFGAAPRAVLEAAERWRQRMRSEEHTSELQSRLHLVCRLLLEKKKKKEQTVTHQISNEE